MRSIINNNSKNLNGLNSRGLATDILMDVIEMQSNPDQSLEKFLKQDKYKSLSREDLAFCKIIMMTTLRRWGHIEIILSRYLKDSIEKHSRRIHIILLISICQIVYLNNAAYAVVNIAINLTKRDRKSSKLSGLVNAVLRKISNEKDSIKTEEMDSLDLLPEWMQVKWGQVYSIEELDQISKTLLSDPPLDLSAKNNNQKIAEDLGGSLLSTGSIRLNNYSYIPSIKYYDDGLWWVQDISASIPIKLVEDNLKGKLFVDLCAAPGGKTANLLAKGAVVTAVDKSLNRLEILKDNLNRLNYEAIIIHADGTKWQPKNKVDGVLIDAPCSSTGVIRRNPDILLKEISNIDYFTETQINLLNNGINMLKKGGVLIYCTCSLEPEEGENQINKILKDRKDIHIREINAEKIPEFKKCIKKEGFMRILPGVIADGGNDGFFISILEKK